MSEKKRKIINLSSSTFSSALKEILNELDLDADYLAYKMAKKSNRSLLSVITVVRKWLKGSKPSHDYLLLLAETAEYDVILIPKERRVQL